MADPRKPLDEQAADKLDDIRNGHSVFFKNHHELETLQATAKQTAGDMLSDQGQWRKDAVVLFHSKMNRLKDAVMEVGDNEPALKREAVKISTEMNTLIEDLGRNPGFREALRTGKLPSEPPPRSGGRGAQIDNREAHEKAQSDGLIKRNPDGSLKQSPAGIKPYTHESLKKPSADYARNMAPERAAEATPAGLSTLLAGIKTGHEKFFADHSDMNRRTDEAGTLVKSIDTTPGNNRADNYNNLRKVHDFHQTVKSLAARADDIATSSGAQLRPGAPNPARDEALQIKKQMEEVLGVATMNPALKEPDPATLAQGPGGVGGRGIGRQPAAPKQPQAPQTQPQISISGPQTRQGVTKETEALEDVKSSIIWIRQNRPQVANRIAAPLKTLEDTANKIKAQSTPNTNDVRALHKAIKDAQDATLPGPRSDATVRSYLEKAKEGLNRVPSLKQDLGALVLPQGLPKLQVDGQGNTGPTNTPALPPGDKSKQR